MPGDYRIYLELGSNIDPEYNLKQAIGKIRQFVKIEKISSVWESPAFGSDGPNFLNMAVQISTDLAPDVLKQHILRKVEAQLGRKRTLDKNAPRTIDIDIVVVNGKVVDDQVWQRAHVAIPLAELIPELWNENEGKSLKQVSEQLSASGAVCRCSNVKLEVTS